MVKDILETYDGKVKFSFRHFPLVKFHQKAHKAAEAAIGAAQEGTQEGKFMEMHEVLLNDRRNLGTISLKSYAREVGVTNKAFLDNLINSKFGWFVQDDLKEGIRLGVEEIPAFFINGKKLKAPVTIENLKAHIDVVLSKKKAIA
ncbi:MAG: oxidoreductase [Segetibacter sp.]|nr:oxidoreductase [Segetibacter sp.]